MATPRQGIKRIVVGLDGSDHAAAALDWAISVAWPLNAEIVAVSALHVPVYAFDPYAIAYPLEYDLEWRAAMKKAFEEEWCKPLRESGRRGPTNCKRPVLLISGKQAAAGRERAAASAREALAAKQEALAAIEEAPLA
jgi:nucleotide-binding universal stress UspA family protein